MNSNVLKSLYLKLGILVFVFLFFLGLFIFVLKIYEKKIISQIEKINSLKELIILNQINKEKELKFQQIKNYFERETGKSVDEILNSVNQKLNFNSEIIKESFLKKINEENWKILNSSFESEENIYLEIEIPLIDIQKLIQFLEENLLFLKIEKLIINKNEKNYTILITFNLK